MDPKTVPAPAPAPEPTPAPTPAPAPTPEPAPAPTPSPSPAPAPAPATQEPDYKALYQAQQQQEQQRVVAEKQNTAISTALAEPTVRAIEPAAVAALFDRKKLGLDKDGNVTGLTEELARVQAAFPKLFEEAGSADGGEGGKTPTSSGNTWFQSLLG